MTSDLGVYHYWHIFRMNYRTGIIAFFAIFAMVNLIYLIQPNLYGARAVLYCTGTKLEDTSNYTEPDEQVLFAHSHSVMNMVKVKKVKFSAKASVNHILTLETRNKDRDTSLKVLSRWVKKYMMFTSLVNPMNKVVIVSKPYAIGKVSGYNKESFIISIVAGTIIGIIFVFIYYYWNKGKYNA